jgi:hypothetical protein
VSKKAKRICLIPRLWSLARVRATPCDARHHHVSARIAKTLVADGDAVWLKRGQVLRRTRQGSLPKERQRDISAKMGAYFNRAYRRKETWALAMLATVRKQWERPNRDRQVSLASQYSDLF